MIQTFNFRYLLAAGLLVGVASSLSAPGSPLLPVDLPARAAPDLPPNLPEGNKEIDSYLSILKNVDYLSILKNVESNLFHFTFRSRSSWKSSAWNSWWRSQTNWKHSTSSRGSRFSAARNCPRLDISTVCIAENCARSLGDLLGKLFAVTGSQKARYLVISNFCCYFRPFCLLSSSKLRQVACAECKSQN